MQRQGNQTDFIGVLVYSTKKHHLKSHVNHLQLTATIKARRSSDSADFRWDQKRNLKVKTGAIFIEALSCLLMFQETGRMKSERHTDERLLEVCWDPSLTSSLR